MEKETQNSLYALGLPIHAVGFEHRTGVGQDDVIPVSVSKLVVLVAVGPSSSVKGFV